MKLIIFPFACQMSIPVFYFLSLLFDLIFSFGKIILPRVYFVSCLKFFLLGCRIKSKKEVEMLSLAWSGHWRKGGGSQGGEGRSLMETPRSGSRSLAGVGAVREEAREI